MVDSKRTAVGDVDFAVMMCRPRQTHELFEGTAYRIPSNMHSITVPAGKKVFFELTSEGGASVTTKRKGEALSKLEKQTNFYHMLFQKTIQPKNNIQHDIRPCTEGDIVIFGYNGIDHITFVKHIHSLNLPYPLIPCWVSRDSVSAWAPNVRFEKAAAEAAAAKAESIMKEAAAKANAIKMKEEIRAALRGRGVDEATIEIGAPPVPGKQRKGSGPRKRKRRRRG